MLYEGIKSHGHKEVKYFNEMATAVEYLAGILARKGRPGADPGCRRCVEGRGSIDKKA